MGDPITAFMGPLGSPWYSDFPTMWIVGHKVEYDVTFKMVEAMPSKERTPYALKLLGIEYPLWVYDSKELIISRLKLKYDELYSSMEWSFQHPTKCFLTAKLRHGEPGRQTYFVQAGGKDSEDAFHNLLWQFAWVHKELEKK